MADTERASLFPFNCLSSDETQRVIRWAANFAGECRYLESNGWYDEDQELLDRLTADAPPQECGCGLPQGNHRC